MTFPRIRAPGMWTLGSVIAPTEMEKFDQDQSEAIDGTGGGVYAPQTRLVIGGSGVDFTGGTAPDPLGPLTSTAAPGTGASGVLGTGDGAGAGGVFLGGATGAAGVSGTGTGAFAGVIGTGGAGGGPGVSGLGGAANGSGVSGTGAGGSGSGVVGLGSLLGSGVRGTGGTTSGDGGTFTGGAGGGVGVRSTGNTTGDGVFGTGGASSGTGVAGNGGGPNGAGVVGSGTGTGVGVKGVTSTSNVAAIWANGGSVLVDTNVANAAYNPPNNSLFATNLPKAWGTIIVNGSGSAAVPADGGHNLQATIRAGSGNEFCLDVTFPTAMASADYSVNVTLYDPTNPGPGSGTWLAPTFITQTKTTGGFTIQGTYLHPVAESAGLITSFQMLGFNWLTAQVSVDVQVFARQ